MGGMHELITGVLEKIIFNNPENHFIIARLKVEKSGQALTISGCLPQVGCGETLQIEGEWTQHPRYGRRLVVKSFVSKLPSSLYGLRKYLGSGLIPQIGPVYAEKIVANFGKDTLEVIGQDSSKLLEVPGIGKKRAAEIKKSWETHQAVRDLMIFLQSYSIGARTCLKLVKRYGQHTQALLRKEPYKIAREISGIGFKSADQIALNLGLPNESAARIQAGLLHVLEQLEGEGHTAYPTLSLMEKTSQLLEVPIVPMEENVKALLDSGEIFYTEEPGKNKVQLAKLHYWEHSIARSIIKLLKCPSSLPAIQVEKAIEWTQQTKGIRFSTRQIEAVRSALEHKLILLTGGPGTGKTTILSALVKVLCLKKTRLALAAPTGRAARKMAESSQHEASTLHRLLKFQPREGKFFYDKNNPLPLDYLIIDESSMLDTFLSRCVLEALPSQAHLMLIGDIHQLPSIGAGQILAELIEQAPHSPLIGLTCLDTIFRQSERSDIVTVAHALLKGNSKVPSHIKELNKLETKKDLHFIELNRGQNCGELIAELYTQILPHLYPQSDLTKSTQVLCPMHRGSGGVTLLNEKLQNILNGKGQKPKQNPLHHLRLGDKVIQTRNNYEHNIFNGDLGFITHIGNGELNIEFDEREVKLKNSECLDIKLAWAISIHKSQGSEFPIVIIPLLREHFVMLERKLLYTAITRARQKVFLIGEPSAYTNAARQTKQTQRCTDLSAKLALIQPNTTEYYIELDNNYKTETDPNNL